MATAKEPAESVTFLTQVVPPIKGNSRVRKQNKVFDTASPGGLFKHDTKLLFFYFYREK